MLPPPPTSTLFPYTTLFRSEERTIKAVLQGVSARVLTADDLETPLSWEGMEAAGSGLGAAAFIVFDDLADMAAVAAGVARFLRSEEHTSELQSHVNIVCRLL